VLQGPFYTQKPETTHAITRSTETLTGEGLIDLHIASPMGSFDSDATTWTEWAGENFFSSLPYTYGTNLYEPRGPERFETQELWWDHIRRHAATPEGSRTTAGFARQHKGPEDMGERGIQNPVQVPEDQKVNPYDFLYELIPDDLLLQLPGSYEEACRVEGG